MKRINLLIVTLLAASVQETIFAGGGAVYSDNDEVPRPSKTPGSAFLRSASGSAKPFAVGAELVEIRLENSSTKGGAGMSGRLNKFRKFIRLDVRGVTPLEQPARVEVRYTIKEGDNTRDATDTVSFSSHAPNFTVDTEGFEDVEGTEVKTSSFIFTTTSKKYKHFSGDIIAAEVTFFDKDGNKLYQGGWPEAPTDVVAFPDRFKPRTFTSSEGRKMKAVVNEVKSNSAVFEINRKLIELDLLRLSKADQDYLRELGKTQLKATGVPMSSNLTKTVPVAPATPKASMSAIAPVPPKTGKALGDLLASIKSSRRESDGSVNVEGVSIPLRFPAPKVPDSYEVSFAIERVSGSGAFLLGVINGSKSIDLKIDYRLDKELRRCHGVGDGYEPCGPTGDRNPPLPVISTGESVEGTFSVTPDRVTLSISPGFQFSRSMDETKPGMPNPPAPFFVGSESGTKFLVKHLTVR